MLDDGNAKLSEYYNQLSVTANIGSSRRIKV